MPDSSGFPMLMKTEDVANSIMKAIERKRHVCIIDGRWCI